MTATRGNPLALRSAAPPSFCFPCSRPTSMASSLEARLILAAADGNLADVKRCLDAHVDPEVRDDDGSSSLIIAAFRGHLPCVRLLCERAGARLDVCNNTFHWDPVLAAAYAGHAKVVSYLLGRGASGCQCDTFGQTALDYARAEGHLDTETVLLRAGAPTGADVARRSKHYVQILPEGEAAEPRGEEPPAALPAATPCRSSRGAAQGRSTGGLSGRSAGVVAVPALPASPAPGSIAFEDDAAAAAAARGLATPQVRFAASDASDASSCDENQYGALQRGASQGMRTRSGRTLGAAAGAAVPPVPPTPAALKPRTSNTGLTATNAGKPSEKPAVAVASTPAALPPAPQPAAACTPRSAGARVPIRGLVSPRSHSMLSQGGAAAQTASPAGGIFTAAAAAATATAPLAASGAVSMSLAAGGDDLTLLPSEAVDFTVGGRWVTRPSLRNAVVGWGAVAAAWLAMQAVSAATAH